MLGQEPKDGDFVRYVDALQAGKLAEIKAENRHLEMNDLSDAGWSKRVTAYLARGAKRGPNTIHILTAEGVRVAHLGDLGHEPDEAQYAAIGRPDVLLIPVGGFYTIDALAAKRVADRIGAGITVPMHYRGEGFGYDVIGTLDEYTRLCAGGVEYSESNSFDPADYHEGTTLVLKAGK